MMDHTKRVLVLVVVAVLSGKCTQSQGAEVISLQAQPFALKDVRLLDGPFKHATDLNRDYLLELEPDRLLAWFRKEAGLEPKAPVYGGWEDRGVAGHCGGHYISACALMYQSTNDQRLLERVNYVVDELALCQQAHGNGYVAAIPRGKEIFQEVAQGDIRSKGFDLNGGWVPLYTLHKLFTGLGDAYQLCGNIKALAVERRLADWLDKTLVDLDHDQMQAILRCEHGGMNEALADLYAYTGEPRYLALSRRFHHEFVLDPLAEKRDNLNGLHANTQIPKLVGLARRYELTGDDRDRAATAFFWERVVKHHSYVTGGHCIREHFGPPDTLSDRLGANTTETCNVYNMLKLTRHLFMWSAEAEVADFYERALYNHILASHHPRDGRVIYNLSLAMGGVKAYQTQFNSFTCCVGSGMENHSKYGRNVYFHRDDSLFVNLFTASELSWRAKGVILRQDTRFPDEPSTRLTWTCEHPVRLTLRLRHPYWIKEELDVSINGRAVIVNSKPSSFASITRTWKSGDRVDIALPMTLRLEAMPDNPQRVAVMYGPLVLAGDLGTADDARAEQPDYVPVLLTKGRSPSSWLQAVPEQACTFRTMGVGRPRDVLLRPFFRIHERRYTVYWDIFTEAQWQAKEAAYQSELAWQQALDAKTVDFFQPGEMQPERDHKLLGEKTSAGRAMGRAWRHAVDGGWFSFAMKVDPNRTQDLICTFWGGDSGGREFDVLVNGATIVTQKLDNKRPGQFYDEVYALPAYLTQGKTGIVIKLQAHPGKTAGGLFGARIIRKEQ